MPLLFKNARVQGIMVGSREMFEAMNRALTVNQVHPVIDKVFPFDQARRPTAISKAARILARSVSRFERKGWRRARKWRIRKIATL